MWRGVAAETTPGTLAHKIATANGALTYLDFTHPLVFWDDTDSSGGRHAIPHRRGAGLDGVADRAAGRARVPGTLTSRSTQCRLSRSTALLPRRRCSREFRAGEPMSGPRGLSHLGR
jgi:hypothetical protein